MANDSSLTSAWVINATSDGTSDTQASISQELLIRRQQDALRTEDLRHPRPAKPSLGTERNIGEHSYSSEEAKIKVIMSATGVSMEAA